jgi:pyruvate kinase
MKIQILCTLGPASLRPDVIEGLHARGIDLFRINLSHTPLEAVQGTIDLIRGHSDIPICLDTEGPQVRCGPMQRDVVLVPGSTVRFTPERVEGSSQEIGLWPSTVFDALEAGSTLRIDFDGAEVRITGVEPGFAVGVTASGGRVRSNRAVTVDPPPDLPALSERDVAAIEAAPRSGITHYALSFAGSAADVDRLRELAPPGAFIMAKIESRAGIQNMDGIIHAADAVVIDRGDLSRDIPIEHVPYYQKAIVRRANRWSRPVYVATNLLQSMVTGDQPTVAEANDIANTLLDGVHGLVLAAETAVGADPLGSVDMVLRAIQAFELSNERQFL